MQLSRLAFCCALLPILTVHTTLFLALSGGNLHQCLPYWSDCHSISATGRQYPEFFVFKALMIPTACLMGAYWYALNVWLRAMLSPKAGRILLLGTLAWVALIVYTVTLGAVGEPYALARRIGVVIFFAFSAFAHLLLLAALKPVARADHALSTNYQRLFGLSWGLLIIALVNGIMGFIWPEAFDHWENAVEWWFALLMMGQYYLVGKMWDSTGFRLQFHHRDDTAKRK